MNLLSVVRLQIEVNRGERGEGATNADPRYGFGGSGTAANIAATCSLAATTSAPVAGRFGIIRSVNRTEPMSMLREDSTLLIPNTNSVLPPPDRSPEPAHDQRPHRPPRRTTAPPPRLP